VKVLGIGRWREEFFEKAKGGESSPGLEAMKGRLGLGPVMEENSRGEKENKKTGSKEKMRPFQKHNWNLS